MPYVYHTLCHHGGIQCAAGFPGERAQRAGRPEVAAERRTLRRSDTGRTDGSTRRENAVQQLAARQPEDAEISR